MGKIIEKIAIEKGHNICLKVNRNNALTFTDEELKKADVAIEFTRPESAINNIKRCFENGVPVVSGTTGWLEKWNQVQLLCESLNGGFFYASNFSIGVNIFFEVNKILANMMNNLNDYDVSIEEIHHTQKLDAPSGTAITLAEGIFQNLKRKDKWVKEKAEDKTDLSIFSKRIKNVPGTHVINYDSEIDSIEIKHTAHSRKGFANGALLAAEFMVGKRGVFGMSDFFKEKLITLA